MWPNSWKGVNPFWINLLLRSDFHRRNDSPICFRAACFTRARDPSGNLKLTNSFFSHRVLFVSSGMSFQVGTVGFNSSLTAAPIALRICPMHSAGSMISSAGPTSVITYSALSGYSFFCPPVSSSAFHSISWLRVVEQRRYCPTLWLLPSSPFLYYALSSEMSPTSSSLSSFRRRRLFGRSKC